MSEPRYASGDPVTIHYHRLPDRLEVFEQTVVDDDGQCVVTFLAEAALKRPMEVGGRVVLEPGSPIVWFTYRGGVWHDVGRFHLADGTFTGFYANVLTPVEMSGPEWMTADLFLDVWMGADGDVQTLDRDEFDAAVAAGWLDPANAARALAEAERLARDAARGAWPDWPVHNWTLRIARARAQRGRARDGR
ncbi:DUF402 domain-containing protein [Longimicrobium sp.]|uniref:DUF402 domain-containing protein n=1 Tax=Longimicrobium sp. TaxID=2029185 RepID=UPI003B3B64CE